MPTRILRNDRPKGGLTQAGKRHDLKAVRWYVLTLPTAAGGRRDRISPSKGLDVELSRRERRGETLFEYFAPSYVEVRKVGGKLVNTRRPLLFNYVFIRSSVEEIFRMKQALPLYNFLPRVSSGSTTYFPHLLDQEMANLRWVAEAYSNELPVYVPESTRLLKGDRVRITSGYFTGMEAEVVIQPGGGHKEVMGQRPPVGGPARGLGTLPCFRQCLRGGSTIGWRGTAGICLFACGDRRDALQAVRVAPPDL